VNKNSSTKKNAEIIDEICQTTLLSLQKARGNPHALAQAVVAYVVAAQAVNLSIDEIENTLGVDDPCIMDLADLSAEDEDVIINAFETFLGTQ